MLLLLFVTRLQAQVNAYTRISREDGTGLSSNVVRSIFQDAKGFIWVGTDNGLQRFDGGKFIQLYTSGPEPLPHTMLSQIIGYDQGRMVLTWASMFEVGIFDPAAFSYHTIPIRTRRHIDELPEYRVWKDARNDLYLIVRRYGVLRYDKKQDAFVEGDFFHLPPGYVPAVTGVFEDTLTGRCWLACEKGLCIYDRKLNQTFYKDHNPLGLPVLSNPLLDEAPWKVHIDQKRRIWIFAWSRRSPGYEKKFCLDSTGAHILDRDTAGLHNRTTTYTIYGDLFETRHTPLWIFGPGALFNENRIGKGFDYITLGRYEDPNDPPLVYQMMEDRDGSLWFATSDGLYFRSAVRSRYTVVNHTFTNDIDPNITEVLEMPGRSFWFASWGKGVVCMDSNFHVSLLPLYTQPPPRSWPAEARASIKLAWSLLRPSGTDQLLVGCNTGVLLQYDLRKKTTQYLLPPACAGATIRCIVEDPQQRIWMGTQSGRLLRRDGDSLRVLHQFGAIIFKIFFDRQGWMWVATQGKGLFVVDPSDGHILRSFRADGSSHGLYNNTGLDIVQLNDSTIAFGAGALNFINKRTGQVRLLRFEDGLPANNVRRMCLDRKGYLWVMTSNGLCRYDPATAHITTYGPKDGMLLSSKATGTDCLTSSGQLLFAGGNSVMIFPPQMFEANQRPPDVTITDLKLFDQYLPVDSLTQLPAIRLRHDQNAFEISFASLSYMQQDRLTYYFKLEGAEEDWKLWDHPGAVNYSILPPGDYTFLVYCENTEGLQSAGITRLHFIIAPPFWQTKWFILLMMLLAATLVYFVHAMRVRRLLAIEKVRNRVARDLHDDIGSTLSTINILSSMAKTKMTVDMVRTSEYLSKIGDNSQRMMEAMDDIVWSIKPSNDSMQKVVARMRGFASSVLEPQDMELEFLADERVFDVRLRMETRRDLFLVFKEAVNNAAKYSRATLVRIRIDPRPQQLFMAVEDNGIGFDPQTADEGNGLGNMKKRVGSMKGTLDIRSKEGQGTTVQITIPTK